MKIAVVLLGILALTPFTLFNHSVPTPADGNVASASGGAHNGALNLSFGAFDRGDGNITGQATFIDDAAKTKVTIDIECLIVSGSQADVGGTVTRSSNPAFGVGLPVHFIVDDQGEGVGVTDYFTAPGNGGCSGGMMAKTLPSDRGNIQVRFVAPDKDCGKCPAGTHCAGNGECVGGGGNLHCGVDEKECCGSCIPKEIGCPACPAGK